MEKFLICLDPDSHQFFSINTNTNDIIVETQIPQKIRLKAEKAFDDLKRLLGNVTKWNFDTQRVNSYRRR